MENVVPASPHAAGAKAVRTVSRPPPRAATGALNRSDRPVKLTSMAVQAAEPNTWMTTVAFADFVSGTSTPPSRWRRAAPFDRPVSPQTDSQRLHLRDGHDKRHRHRQLVSGGRDLCCVGGREVQLGVTLRRCRTTWPVDALRRWTIRPQLRRSGGQREQQPARRRSRAELATAPRPARCPSSNRRYDQGCVSSTHPMSRSFLTSSIGRLRLDQCVVHRWSGVKGQSQQDADVVSRHLRESIGRPNLVFARIHRH